MTEIVCVIIWIVGEERKKRAKAKENKYISARITNEDESNGNDEEKNKVYYQHTNVVWFELGLCLMAVHWKFYNRGCDTKGARRGSSSWNKQHLCLANDLVFVSCFHLTLTCTNTISFYQDFLSLSFLHFLFAFAFFVGCSTCLQGLLSCIIHIFAYAEKRYQIAPIKNTLTYNTVYGRGTHTHTRCTISFLTKQTIFVCVNSSVHIVFYFWRTACMWVCCFFLFHFICVRMCILFLLSLLLAVIVAITMIIVIIAIKGTFS